MHHRINEDDRHRWGLHLAMICARPIKGNHVLRTPIRKRSGRLTPRERETPGRISRLVDSRTPRYLALSTPFLSMLPFYAALMTRFAIAVGAALKK